MEAVTGVTDTQDVQPRTLRRDEQPRPGLRFDDDYWDDAFDTLYDPTMRVCSAFGCC